MALTTLTTPVTTCRVGTLHLGLHRTSSPVSIHGTSSQESILAHQAPMIKQRATLAINEYKCRPHNTHETTPMELRGHFLHTRHGTLHTDPGSCITLDWFFLNSSLLQPLDAFLNSKMLEHCTYLTT